MDIDILQQRRRYSFRPLEKSLFGDHTNHHQPHPEHVLSFIEHLYVFICYISRYFKFENVSRCGLGWFVLSLLLAAHVSLSCLQGDSPHRKYSCNHINKRRCESRKLETVQSGHATMLPNYQTAPRDVGGADCAVSHR